MTVRQVSLTGEHVARLAKGLRKVVGEVGPEGLALLDLVIVRALGAAPESRKDVPVPGIFFGVDRKGGRIPLLRVASMALGIDAVAIGPKQDDPAAIGPKQDDPAAIGPKQDDPAAIGPKQDDPAAIGPKQDDPAAIGPKQDDPAAIGPKQDDPAAIGPKQDDPAAIGPKQDDPVNPPKFEFGVIMGERGGESWGVIMGERRVRDLGVIMDERKPRGGHPGVREVVVTHKHVGAFARALGALAARLTPEEQALLDLLLIRGGEPPPEDTRGARVPALFYDPDDEEYDVDETRTLALAVGVDATAIGPKQDDPSPPPPDIAWGVIMGERGTGDWSKMFARRRAR